MYVANFVIELIFSQRNSLTQSPSWSMFFLWIITFGGQVVTALLTSSYFMTSGASLWARWPGHYKSVCSLPVIGVAVSNDNRLEILGLGLVY